MSNYKFTFPVGYHNFHKDTVFNFQLNRWHSLGYARFKDFESAVGRIKDFDDWKNAMIKLAENAVTENRLINAAFYYRAAEFYILSGSSEKEFLYDKFSKLFYKAFEKDNIERFNIPYEETFLPAIKIQSGKDKKGTIVMIGGFDSFIEEWYSMMRYFSEHGYEVIGFEGFGQGAALKKYGHAFNYKWEKPVKTILDYFEINDAIIHGLSMGGWYCFRAAAFEPRITKVIASGIVYDMLKTPPLIVAWMMDFLYKKLRNYTNKLLLKNIEKGGMQAWQTANMMYISKKETPIDAFDAIAELNYKNLHSELVKQDVLILTSKNDHLIPFKMHKMQVKALTNAKSVTSKIFTKEEHAHNHCQIGNIGLALETIVKWLDSKK
ncbi:alpha/beta hydrolase family protein [Bacteroidota bacterium]